MGGLQTVLTDQYVNAQFVFGPAGRFVLDGSLVEIIHVLYKEVIQMLRNSRELRDSHVWTHCWYLLWIKYLASDFHKGFDAGLTRTLAIERPFSALSIAVPEHSALTSGKPPELVPV